MVASDCRCILTSDASESGIRDSDALQKIIDDLQTQSIPLKSLPYTNHASVQGVSINMTMGQVVRAQSTCMQELFVLPPGLRDWAVSLTNKFIAEMIKSVIHPQSSSPHSDNVNDSNQSGSSNDDISIYSHIHFEDHALLHSDRKIKKEEFSELTEVALSDDDTCCGMTETSSSLSGSPAKKKHKPCLTKSVPASYVYNFRGVRCPICYYSFRGMKCVDELEQHVKAYHKERATPKALEEIRASSTLEKIVGCGLRYCDCEMCEAYMRGEGLIM